MCVRMGGGEGKITKREEPWMERRRRERYVRWMDIMPDNKVFPSQDFSSFLPSEVGDFSDVGKRWMHAC